MPYQQRVMTSLSNIDVYKFDYILEIYQKRFGKNFTSSSLLRMLILKSYESIMIEFDIEKKNTPKEN